MRWIICGSRCGTYKGECDTCKATATVERRRGDSGDALGYCDACEVFVIVECILGNSDNRELIYRFGNSDIGINSGISTNG